MHAYFRNANLGLHEFFVLQATTFQEVAACGTAVVLTPIISLTKGEHTYEYPTFDTMSRIRTHVVGIQAGEIPDKHGWLQDI